MTTACATSATEAARSGGPARLTGRSGAGGRAPRPTVTLLGAIGMTFIAGMTWAAGMALAATTTPPAQGTPTAPTTGAPAAPAPSAPASAKPSATVPAGAAKPSRLMTPADLRDRFEKCLKMLGKAEGALDGRDPGRVSLLLRRTDELILEWEAGSGLPEFLRVVAEAREAAAADDRAGAASSVRRAREVLRSLADYTVSRSAEVSFRASLAALEAGKADEFDKALSTFEATVHAPYLSDRVREGREAIARGRAAMVRKDMKNGRKEVEAASAAFGGLEYAASLSQARYGLMVAAELLREGSTLTAKEQTQNGLRALNRALERAPQTHVQGLDTARSEADVVWRRLSKPEAGDPDRLDGAAAQVETIRQELR
jgi:hypothetical protein